MAPELAQFPTLPPLPGQAGLVLPGDHTPPGMASFAASPFDVPQAISTGQPPGRYVRRPQNAKFFTYIHQFVPGTTTGWGAGALSIRDSFQIDGDADFHILKQSVLAFVTATGAPNLGDTLAFEVSPVSESFNFAETFLSNYGTGRLPSQLQTPIVLPRNAIYSAKASSRNNGGLQTTIFIAHFGAKVYRNAYLGQRVYRQQKPYTYLANFTAFDGGVGQIAAGSTAIFSLRTDGDSDFDVRKLTVVADAPVTIQIRSDDDNWFHRPIRSELLGGSQIEVFGAQGSVSGELPFFMPVPRLITAAGYLNFQVTNSDVVNAIDCQIGVWGQRLYPAGGVRS